MGSTAAPANAEGFAQQLYRNWKTNGINSCENGILFFIATGDRQYAFILGRNAKKLLGKRRMRNVERVLTRYMKQNNLYLGVYNAVRRLGQELGSASPRSGVVTSPIRGLTRRSWWFYVVVTTASLAALSLVFACCNGFGGKDAVRRKKLNRAATKKLRLIKQEYEYAILPQYTPITCSVCQRSLTPGLAEAASAPHDGEHDAATYAQAGDGAAASKMTIWVRCATCVAGTNSSKLSISRFCAERLLSTLQSDFSSSSTSLCSETCLEKQGTSTGSSDGVPGMHGQQ